MPKKVIIKTGKQLCYGIFVAVFTPIIIMAFASCPEHGGDIIETDYQPSSFSGLPVLEIDTQGIIIYQKSEWIRASYSLLDEAGNPLSNGETGIRGRGNTTWDMPKKPYNLNLDSAASLFYMPSQRRFALLANYADKTLLRTSVAFEKLGKIFDNLAWTPKSRHVDLYLNGSYRGVYQLTENVRVDRNRVNINSISPSNGDGGFLLEISARLEDEFNFTTKRGVPFNCSSPDDNLDRLINGKNLTVFDKIKSYIQEVEDVLYSDNFKDETAGWQKYLDAGTFVDWYLVNEITKNNDAIFFSSVYMYYDNVKRKLFMGPLWDFDISLGNIDYNGNDNPAGFWIRGSLWVSRLFEDPYFVSAVKARWNEKKAELNTVSQYIDESAAYLRKAQTQNFQKWLILDKYVWPNAEVPGSYSGEIAYLKTWFQKRTEWLDSAINGL